MFIGWILSAIDLPLILSTSETEMLAFLREITVTCFFCSYLLVLLVEGSRLWRRVPGRGLVVIIMSSLGLFAHFSYLFIRAYEGLRSDSGILASWLDWSLLLSFILSTTFLVFFVRRPDTMVGFFFLPAIMILILIANISRDIAPFSRTEATQLWTTVHALAMMLGSLTVLLGFLSGCMYLVQSWRLKSKRAGSGFRLPTLESLNRMNRRCLMISTVAVAGGLTAGVAMNLNRIGQIGLMDRTVQFSVLLLVWLIITTFFEFYYAPVSHSRKGIYMTLASLGFLILAMFGALTTSHGGTEIQTSQVHPKNVTTLAQNTWITLQVAGRVR